MQTKMILRPPSVHSNTEQLALEVSTQLGKIQNWTSGYFGNYVKKIFLREFLLKVDYSIRCIIVTAVYSLI